MTIDGKNIQAVWNMCLIKDSFNSLLKYPKRKTVNYTNYAEKDGITPDLRKFETESRQVSLIFFIRHSSECEFYSIYDDFFAAINDSGYHTFDFEIGIIYKFRYDKTQSFKSIRLFNSSGGTSFTIDFIEDDAAINGSITSPVGNPILTGWFMVDGVDFGDFGIHPNGAVGEVLKYPDAKESFTDGRAYSLSTRMIKHKEITIPLWMRANSKSDFIHNYQAFYNTFAKPGKRFLYVKELGASTYCYYRDCADYRVSWKNTPGAFFSISICIPVATWLSGTTNILRVLTIVPLTIEIVWIFFPDTKSVFTSSIISLLISDFC